MTISWFFIFIFLIAILGEMFYLGRYISISQNIFHNKTTASFALGAIVYFVITYAVLLPFVWFHLTIMYYAIIILIKDFFTVVFLVIRREILSDFKQDNNQILGLIASGILIPIFFVYVIEPNFSLKRIDVNYTQQIWTLFTHSATDLSRGKSGNVEHFLINPIVSMVIYASVSAWFLEFSRKKGFIQIILTIIITALFLFFFNLNTKLMDLIYVGFIIMLFYTSYNMIMMSRRRYALLYGLITFSIWGVESKTFWLLVLSAFVTFSTYLIFKKPRPTIFFLQLMSPLLILSSFRLISISVVLSIAISILGTVFYIMIFVIGRIKWIEKTNMPNALKYYRLATIIFVMSIISILNIVILAKQHHVYYEFIKGNELINYFENNTFRIILNVLYYFIFSFVVGYSIYNFYYHKKFTKMKLVMFMSFISYLLMFNPFTQILFNHYLPAHSYASIKVFAFSPMLIAIMSKINIKNIENIFKKNKT